MKIKRLIAIGSAIAMSAAGLGTGLFAENSRQEAELTADFSKERLK